MLGIESIEILTKKISDRGGSDKEIEKIINSLKEFRELEKRITELKRVIKGLIESKQINKYIELNEKIYCLETLEEFEIISASENELKNITNIEKQINKECSEIESLINQSDDRLEDLTVQKRELLEKLFLEQKYKAINTENVLILKEYEDNLIFFKD